jgi:hypothetical protein
MDLDPEPAKADSVNLYLVKMAKEQPWWWLPIHYTPTDKERNFLP